MSDTVDKTMTDFVIADTATGKIAMSGQIPAFMIPLQVLKAGQAVFLGKGSAATSYIVAGVITLRPPNPSSISGMKISNVPNPSNVTIDGGVPSAVTDGEIDLSFEQPGNYSVRVMSWPPLDAVFTVTQT